MPMKKILLIACVAALLMSCRHGQANEGLPQNDSTITSAQLLTLERADSFTLAVISDPWHNGMALHRYVLVPDSLPLPASLPEGTVVRTPIKRALVYSGVHTSLMKEFGCWDAVKGVCDAQFFTDPDVHAGVNNGAITDCGSSMTPTIEKVIAMQPDAIFLSPYQDATYGPIEKMNIPLIECADYMEMTPLGRAEWMKFYGELLGCRERADSAYAAVVQTYQDIKEAVRKTSHDPVKVLTEMVISGVWNVPGGHSYMARLIEDAGGIYPWADNESTGSLNLDFNQVLAQAQDADVWLIKSFYIHSYADLKGAYGLNDQFEAFKWQKVYVCDTNATRFFERFPFHPEVLLAEYAHLFAGQFDRLQFYKPLAQ